MSPLNAAICTTISYTLSVEWYYLKNNYLTLEVKGQGPMKVIMVCDTPPYGPAPTYQISLTYLERQKCYGPDKKILFKKPLFDLQVKGQGPTKVIMVRDTPPKSSTNIPNIIDLSGKTKKLWSGKASLSRSRRSGRRSRRKKSRLKQYVSLRSKGRHNYRIKLKSQCILFSSSKH